MEKKLWGFKNPENVCLKKVALSKKGYIFLSFLFLLQGNSYTCLVLKFQVSKLKIEIELIKLLTS